MCGATSAQTTLQDEQMQELQQYDAMMQQQYANQQAIYKQVNSVLQPIIAKGPSQEGFSTDEKNVLNAQAVEGTAENYSEASRALNEKLAAAGGGNIPVTTGQGTELQAEMAASAAQTESSEETGVKEADYQQGYSEFENAENGELAIAAGDNPLGWAGATTTAGEAAGTTASQIAAENNSWINAALGAAGSIGSAVVGENPGGVFGA